MTIAWLIVVLAGLLVWTVKDTRQYREFMHLESSAERCHFYRKWIIQSFLILVGGTIVTVVILRHGLSLVELPAEFRPLATLLTPSVDDHSTGDGWLGVALGFAIGLCVVIAVQVWRFKKMRRPVDWNIEPLLPRNRNEMLAAVPLCLNAGFSEELFFRLALPLLITSITESAIIGFVSSAIIFGLTHSYQGLKGVIGSMITGAFLTIVYLKTGSLLHPIALHIAIDLFALLVRPAIAAHSIRMADS